MNGAPGWQFQPLTRMKFIPAIMQIMTTVMKLMIAMMKIMGAVMTFMTMGRKYMTTAMKNSSAMMKLVIGVTKNTIAPMKLMIAVMFFIPPIMKLIIAVMNFIPAVMRLIIARIGFPAAGIFFNLTVREASFPGCSSTVAVGTPRVLKAAERSGLKDLRHAGDGRWLSRNSWGNQKKERCRVAPLLEMSLILQ